MSFRPVISNQIIITTVLVLLVLLAMSVFFLTLGYQYRAKGSVHYTFTFSGCLMLLIIIGFYAFRIRSYEINSGNLIIRTGYGKKVISLAGLQDARPEEKPFAGARKEGGMGGVWSFYGKFSNAKLGRFNSYATGSSTGVLLVWPEQKIFVTPENPTTFIQAVKGAR